MILKSDDLKEKALKDEDFRSEYGNDSVVVKIEDEYNGLTTLYYPKIGDPNLEYAILSLFKFD